MKSFFAFPALLGAVGWCAPLRARDNRAAPAATPAAPAPAAAAAPAAPPAPTKPELVDGAKINSGDTAWMLASTALVLLMTIPGLALFYGGMVRKKNVLATVMQSFAITCLVTVLWVIVGYSLAFTPGNAYFGGFDRLFLSGKAYMKEGNKVTVSHLGGTIPEALYKVFPMTFAIITPALIAGALADRMK